MSFHPYVNFGGNCREAFTRYHEILGGEVEILMMDDVPGDVPDEMKGMVANASLTLDGDLFMGSDDPSGTFSPPSGMHLNHTLSDLVEARRIFAALTEGGKVEMEFGETFWSPGFGVCVDRFGTPWMINTEPSD